MNVGFYLTKHDEIGYVYASYLVDSIRQHMPGVLVHQFTDMKSPGLPEVDAVHRLAPAPLCIARANHYRSLKGDWLLLDTDCVVQADVRDVFHQAFDVAVTDRNWIHVQPNPSDVEMPYCTGVVFSRSPQFWDAVHSLVSKMSLEDQKWYGEQKAVARLVDSEKFRIAVLPGMIFQYPPFNDEPVAAPILHYKGNRKNWLTRRIHKELIHVR